MKSVILNAVTPQVGLFALELESDKKEKEMIVRVDVYTKDVDAALFAFKAAFETGASYISLSSSDDRDARVVRN